MGFDPKEKMITSDRIEKYVLRKAFDTSDDPEAKPYLPKDILWRQKEQFSDGVGYGWVDCLKHDAEEKVTDEMMADVAQRFPQQTPSSKEGYLYRTIFDSIFKNPTACLTVPVGPSIACSTPTAFRWSQEFAKMEDPSGRAVKGVHLDAINTI